MYTPEELTKRLNQILDELRFAPVEDIEDGDGTLRTGITLGAMGKSISVTKRMVALLINDIADEAERDRLAEEERARRLAEYRRQQEMAKTLEAGPGGEADA